MFLSNQNLLLEKYLAVLKQEQMILQLYNDCACRNSLSDYQNKECLELVTAYSDEAAYCLPNDHPVDCITRTSVHCSDDILQLSDTGVSPYSFYF